MTGQRAGGPAAPAASAASAWAWLTAVSICILALALAAAARHWLIEPADMSARCDAGGADLWCVVRAWIIQSFVQQRIGWFALVAACVATVTAWRSVAAVALCAACAGLLLYTTALCAPAALLALLVLVRERQPAGAASTSIKPQNASA